MSTNRKQNLIWTSHIAKGAGKDVAHGEIAIRGEYWNTLPIVTFEWQAHELNPAKEAMGNQWKPGWSDWYAFTIKIEASNLTSLDNAHKVVNAIMRPFKKEGRMKVEPHELIDRLERMTSATESVWDPRVSKYVPLDDVKPDEYNRYIDDFRALGRSSATQGCVARSTEEARGLIAAALAKNDRHEEALIAFIQNGRPVMMTDQGAPDVTPASAKF